MSIPLNLLPAHWYWVATVLYGLLLVHLIRRAPWVRLKDKAKLNAYLGTCVMLMVLWWIKTPLLPGTEYHYLGATLLTLMFGWRLAMAGMSFVLAASALNGEIDALNYPLNALIMGLVPVMVSHGILKASERFLPPNFFVYVFLAGYWGAALAMVCAVLAAWAVLWAGGAYSFAVLADRYFPLLVLLAIPEGMITGMLITMMAVFRPAWVSTFDDNRYLNGR
ncbi:MAG: hypothetical protein KatS3mg123_1871 [Burkholderiales bacterium]|nr:MAG: hypothetical protein KatS3mg123_1871 [Burkholderiales bacterium]